MFDQELITLGFMADRVAPPLRRVLAEILPLKSRVSKWVSVPASGSTVCQYDTMTHEPKSYEIKAQSCNLGNVVHELTHVAVNEAYGLDFVNYPSPDAQNVPARVYDKLGYPDAQNVMARREQFRNPQQDQERTRVLDDLIAKANAARGQLGDERLSLLVSMKDQGSFIYGKFNIHIEFDTIINQTFVWLHEWASDDMKRAESRTERAMLGRVAKPGSNPTPALFTGVRPRSYAVGSADDARVADPMQILFDSLARQVDAACDRREQARLAKGARPRSYAVGSAGDAKARAT